MFDIKITGGTLLDGAGGQPFRADIGIQGDRISDIGDLTAADSGRELDATELIVCPGFIDAHSHSDTYLLIEPSAPSKLFQGITTEVVGNCGASAAPISSLVQLPSDWAEHEYPGSWQSVAEYLALLESRDPAPNVLPLIGHARLRGTVMGLAARAPSPDELSAMTLLLEESLEQGGRGLSAGLIYAPGSYSTQAELETLAAAVARHDAVFACHLRSEGRRLIEALEEMIAIGRSSGARVQISHLKTSGRANWSLADEAIESIRDQVERGLQIAADRYPYTSGCTELDVIFPDWVAEGGRFSTLKRLRHPGSRIRLRKELLASFQDADWAAIVVGSTNHPDNERFRGLPLLEVAAALDVDPAEATLILTDKDCLKTSAFFGGMSEENMWKILAEPFVMIGTDSSLRAPQGPLGLDYPHPRAYGAMPKFLRASLDGKTVPLPEAIRKMTSLPAEQFKIEKRGRLLEGWMADIAIFNPGTITDTATYAAPHSLSEGMEFVIVNGVLSLDQAGLTGARAGRVLR